MATGLGRLTVDMVMRTAGFEQGMSRAERIAQQRSRQMQRQINMVSTAIIGAATAAQAFAQRMIQSSIQSIDATTRLAEQVGLTTESLTGMRYAAQQFSNISDTNFDMAIRRMIRRVAEAAQGTGAASSALRSLGLDARELARMNPEQQFMAIADAMSQIGDRGTQLRNTMAIFDTQGMPLVNALAKGSEELGRMQERAERLGFTLSDIDAKVIQDLALAQRDLGNAFDSIMQKAVVGVAPAMTEMATDILRLIESIENVGDRAADIFESINSVIQVTAVLIGSRLAGATLSAAAGFSAQAAANVIANYQLARTMDFGRAASTALAGVAVAGRASAIAMSLVGGPFGALVLLAGSAYMAFRQTSSATDDYAESLRLLEQPLEDVSEKLRTMTRDQQENLRFAAQAAVDAQVEIVDRAVKDLENKIAGGMAGMFRGTAQEFTTFIDEVYGAIAAGESLTDTLERAASAGFIRREHIQPVVELSAAADEAKGKLDELTDRARKLDDAIASVGDSAGTAAGQVSTLNEAFLEALEEGRKYTDRLADRLITAGIDTEIGKLNAMVDAGKLAFETEQDLNQAREHAARLDAIAARTSKSAASNAKAQAEAIQSVIDRLLPMQKITRDYEQDQTRLNAAYSSGKINADQLAEAMTRLNQERDKAIQNLIPEEIKRMQELERTAQSSIQSLITQQERQLAVLTMGEDARDLASALQEVEDRYRGIAESMAASERGISQDELDTLRQYMDMEMEIIQEYHDRKMELNESWLHGMHVGLQEYVDSVGSASEQMSNLMMSAFGHVEDALFDLVTTGEVDVAGLIRSLAEDVVRMMIRMGLQMAANFAMAKLFGTTSAAMAAVQGTAMASAYAPAAALASLASFGANAAPAMAGITSTLALTHMSAFAGLFDEGGTIPAGQWGIVGEIGPEIVQGPARVTSREDTARMLGGGRGQTIVQVIENPDRAGEVDRFDEGEDEIVRVFVTDINNNGPIMRTLSERTNVTRVGR